MKKDIVITKEGLQKLEAELKALREDRRPEVIARIKTAKELGDLSENAEYTAAKEEQSFIEGRIQELEEIIKHAKLVSSQSNHDKTTISIGSRVKVDIEGDEDEFEIVGQAESDPANGKISVDSPVGQALLGHKAKETIKVETPDGVVAYKITAVS